jgi:hypothetical protein
MGTHTVVTEGHKDIHTRTEMGADQETWREKEDKQKHIMERHKRQTQERQ